LSIEDDELLRLSIKKDGIQIPLIVWRRGKRIVILSGSNRLRIASELGLKTVPVIIRQFADQNAAKAFAVCDNLARRQLTTWQRAYLAYQFQQLLAVGAGRKASQKLSPAATNGTNNEMPIRIGAVRSKSSPSSFKDGNSLVIGIEFYCAMANRLSPNYVLAAISTSTARMSLTALNWRWGGIFGRECAADGGAGCVGGKISGNPGGNPNGFGGGI
jgi:hypothetical protein